MLVPLEVANKPVSHHPQLHMYMYIVPSIATCIIVSSIATCTSYHPQLYRSINSYMCTVWHSGSSVRDGDAKSEVDQEQDVMASNNTRNDKRVVYGSVYICLSFLGMQLSFFVCHRYATNNWKQ